MTPARAHYLRVSAEMAQAHTQAGSGLENCTEYELMLVKLAADRRRLKSVQSMERKAEVKRGLLPDYAPWIDGVLAAGRGAQDEVLMSVMVWRMDAGDFEGALDIADYALQHSLVMPDRYQRTTATVIAEEVADTAIKQQEAGNGPSYGLLCAYLELLTHCDIFDQVRAKLHKAVGRAALAEGLKPQAAEHYRRAIELHDKVGIKKELEVLERELKKEQQPDATGGGS